MPPMRLASLALIAAALGAQEAPSEPKVAASESGIKYLYAGAGPDKAPLLFLLPSSPACRTLQCRPSSRLSPP